MKYLFAILICSLATALETSAKSPVIDVKKELDSATLIKYVRIIAYRDTLMVCVPLNSKDTFFVNCKDKAFCEELKVKQIASYPDSKSSLENTCPKTGDSILLVMRRQTI